MAAFLDDLAAYLKQNGLKNICCDFMKDTPDDCVGLFLWSHTTPAINDGSGTRYVQVQARDKTIKTAYQTAHKITRLLDSGPDETVIDLTADRWCIARPRAFPKKLHEDEKGRVVYYCEFALWGDNQE